MRKKLILWVRPGVFEVRASPLLPSKELINDDFPTLERPRKAISGRLPSTQWSRSKALLTNSALVIFTKSSSYRIDSNLLSHTAKRCRRHRDQLTNRPNALCSRHYVS